jgi:hypothetical protein
MMCPQFLQINRPFDRTVIARNLPSTTQLGATHLFLRHSEILHLAANIGRSLIGDGNIQDVLLTRRSPYMLAGTIFFVWSAAQQIQIQDSIPEHAHRAVESSTRMTGFRFRLCLSQTGTFRFCLNLNWP